MCRKNRSAKQLSERSRKAARSTTNQKMNNKDTRNQAYIENNNVRDTWVEDVSLQFAGVINVPATEEKAIKIATDASNAAFDPSHLFLFTHGSSIPSRNTKTQKETSTNQEVERLAGAAVICREPTTDGNNSSWFGLQWGLGRCNTSSSAEASFFAISGCLTIAIEYLRRANPELDAKPTITIFAHDQEQINKIDRVRYIDSTTERSDATTVLIEIVKKSQQLHNDFGAVIEIFCIPCHAAVEGNRLAEGAAREAALDCSNF